MTPKKEELNDAEQQMLDWQKHWVFPVLVALTVAAVFAGFEIQDSVAQNTQTLQTIQANESKRSDEVDDVKEKLYTIEKDVVQIRTRQEADSKTLDELKEISKEIQKALREREQ